MAENKGKGRENRATRAARLICLILVILMLLGTASTAILFLLASRTVTSAAGYTEPTVSIGIKYGSSATSSFRTYSDTCYTLLSQRPDGDRSYVKLGNVSEKVLIVAPHDNLAVSGTGFESATENITVGGYRIDISKDYATFDEAESAARNIAANGYQAFPAYIGGVFRVRVGNFATFDAAEYSMYHVSSVAGEAVSISAPSASGVSVITPEGLLKFEFDNGSATYLGLCPAGEGGAYLRTDNSYIYEGVFMYRRDGTYISVINMLGLETYIEGVLPYEISSSWHIEAQKAFAVAARSYAMGNIGKHSYSYGFDLCSSTNCQVYKGAGGVTETVKKAVADTAGQVLEYNGKTATLYYSSSTGGCTVSAEDCWGGSTAAYLQAVDTPWERYTEYGNGLWSAEVTPTELCAYLRDKGYTTLTDSIASVTVTEYAENSTYVKELLITDVHGNSVSLKNTDKIRTTLSKYLKSANFTVGKGSTTRVETTVTQSSDVQPYSVLDMSSFNIFTSLGKVLFEGIEKPRVATGSGETVVEGASGYVITADNAAGGDLVPSGYSTVYENKTLTAADPESFIFAGKGWGHGVGLSQYGTKDLAEFGYTYDRILAAYVPAAVITTVSELG